MRLHEIRRVLKPRPEVFAYAVNLGNTHEWDPMVVSAKQVAGRIGVGARFELMLKIGAINIPMVYEITEYEPDYRVTLVGRSSSLEAVDDIKFLEDGDNTIIDYTAHLTFRNFVKFAEPLLAPFLRRAGSRSVDALVATLEG